MSFEHDSLESYQKSNVKTLYRARWLKPLIKRFTFLFASFYPSISVGVPVTFNQTREKNMSFEHDSFQSHKKSNVKTFYSHVFSIKPFFIWLVTDYEFYCIHHSYFSCYFS